MSYLKETKLTILSKGWGEVEAQTIETRMNAELMYHTKLRHGRYIVAEFLINDFRFFNEIMSYRNLAKAFKALQSSGKFNAHEAAQVHLRVRLSDRTIKRLRLLTNIKYSVTT